MGIASITVGMDGVPVTKPTRYTNFCSKYTQSTEEGFKDVQNHINWAALKLLELESHTYIPVMQG